MKPMTPGIKGKQELTVRDKDTAKVYGSGSLEVFGTPAMIALMEKTAWKSVAGELEPGTGTVGTKVSVEHTAATSVGNTVWCETELVEVDRRRLVFRARMYDEAGEIGSGVHERFIVRNDGFQEKAEARGKA